MMLIAIIATILGLALLVYSADYFIDGASSIALKFGMPKFLIGMLIIGIGTSAPELVVSVLSAMQGSSGLALGNAYGSNIVNITLVLGATAILSPLFIPKSLVRGDFLILIGVTLLALFQLLDYQVSRLDGAVLIIVLIVMLIVQIVLAKTTKKSQEEAKAVAINMPIALLKLVGGLTVLVLSSRLVVWGAVEIAGRLGLPEVVIGLTVVAVGTSLPELVSSLIAAKKGEHEMALGNVIGSNIFNTLGVVGVAALISPMAVDAEILTRDVALMTVVTLLLFVVCLVALARNQKLSRRIGTAFFGIFVAYTTYLVATALT